MAPVIDIEVNQGINGNKNKNKTTKQKLQKTYQLCLPFLIRKRSISEPLLGVVKHVSFNRRRGKEDRKTELEIPIKAVTNRITTFSLS